MLEDLCLEQRVRDFSRLRKAYVCGVLNLSTALLLFFMGAGMLTATAVGNESTRRG